MSDITSSENSSDPDYQPSRIITDNLALLNTRQTRSRVKHNRRSKSLNDHRSLTNNKFILEQSTRLVGSTETILDTTSNLLEECKNILDTTNPPLHSREEDQEPQNYSINQDNRQTPEREEHSLVIEEKKITWSVEDIVYKENPSISWWSLNQEYSSAMATNQNEEINTDIKKLIEQNVREALRTQTQFQKESNTITSTQIGLQDAIRLLPDSFDGKDMETLELFLEKCEFAVSCVVEAAIPKLLQAIQTRLVGKARQIVKYKTFEKWEELRELLKTNLEPQRTTPYLYLELYAMKQKNGEDVLSYSMRIEQLQNLLVEQETADLSPESAKAIERTINKQVIQVFMEGLGELKHYIKARNPDTLERAIQAAREEERIRNSNRGAKQYLRDSKTSKNNQQYLHTTGNCHNCGVKGHYAKFCTKKMENQKTWVEQGQKSVHQITCNYCKKVGHKVVECRKRAYNQSKKDAENQQGPSDSSKKTENSRRQARGERPAGNLQTAIIQLQEHSHAHQN